MFKKFKEWITGEKEEVIEEIVEIKEDIAEEVEELKEKTSEFIEDKKDDLEEFKEEVVDKKEEVVEEIKEEIEDIKSDIVEKTEDLREGVIDKKEELSENIVEEIKDAKEELSEKTEELIEEVVEKTEEASEKVEDRKDEIIEETVEIKEEIIEKVEDIKEETVEKIEEVKEVIEEKIEEKPVKKGFFQKLLDGLDKTRQDMTSKINSVFSAYHKVDEELFDDLEEILVTADIGINTTMEIIDNLRDKVKENRVTEPEVVRDMLKEEIENTMIANIEDNKLNIEPSPAIILVVGVNGVGKTTTIGKLSNNLKQSGKSVLVAAGDTFRAAAIEQLEEWGNRANVDVISHSEGADPAAVIYDGIQAAKSRKIDVLICDTAGRLHNKKNLMNELNKIFRVVENEYSDATLEVLLVLDATTGQNAILQAKTFKEVVNISGIALTKLDGTAKGGVVIALQSELGIPVKLVGVGEGIDDLQEFDSKDFVEAIFK